MSKENPKDLVPQFFNDTSNSYDKIVNYTTFGRDSFWKHKILEQLSNEKTVLDLACGTGILTKQIVEKLPRAEIVGVDITKNYLEKAKNKLLQINSSIEKEELLGFSDYFHLKSSFIMIQIYA